MVASPRLAGSAASSTSNFSSNGAARGASDHNFGLTDLVEAVELFIRHIKYHVARVIVIRVLVNILVLLGALRALRGFTHCAGSENTGGAANRQVDRGRVSMGWCLVIKQSAHAFTAHAFTAPSVGMVAPNAMSF